MRKTLTRLGLAGAILTAAIGLSSGVATAAPAAGGTSAQAGAAQLAARQWTYMGSYGRYEWCRYMVENYYWPAFDATCYYNNYRNTYDLYVLM